MPILPDINAGSIYKDDTPRQIESIIRQLNEWGRLISNESTTRVIRSDMTTEAVTIGDLGGGKYGISLSDGKTTFLTIFKDGIILNDGTNDRILIGKDEGGF